MTSIEIRTFSCNDSYHCNISSVAPIPLGAFEEAAVSRRS